MLRLSFVFILLATPLAAQDKAALCATSGEIVEAAVAARLDGTPTGRATRMIKRSLTGDKANFKPAVEPLVTWVYSEPEENMGPQLPEAYVAACLKN